MAVLGERARPPRVKAGARVVEDQRAIFEVALRQLRFNSGLPIEKPVEGRVEILGSGISHAELGRQARLLPRACVRQLGTGVYQALGDHGDDQAPLGAGPRGEDAVESDLPHGSKDGFHVSVGESADDAEYVVDADEGFPLEKTAEGLDPVFGPMGEIRERFLDDFSVLAMALAEQDGWWGVAVGHRFDVHGNYVHYTTTNIKQ